MSLLESVLNIWGQNETGIQVLLLLESVLCMQTCGVYVRARVYLFCRPLNQCSNVRYAGVYSRPRFALVGGGPTRQGSKLST